MQVLPALRGAGLASGGTDGAGADVGPRRAAWIAPRRHWSFCGVTPALGSSTAVMKVVSCTVRMLRLEQCVKIDGACSLMVLWAASRRRLGRPGSGRSASSGGPPTPPPGLRHRVGKPPWALRSRPHCAASARSGATSPPFAPGCAPPLTAPRCSSARFSGLLGRSLRAPRRLTHPGLRPAPASTTPLHSLRSLRHASLARPLRLSKFSSSRANG